MAFNMMNFGQNNPSSLMGGGFGGSGFGGAQATGFGGFAGSPLGGYGGGCVCGGAGCGRCMSPDGGAGSILNGGSGGFGQLGGLGGFGGLNQAGSVSPVLDQMMGLLSLTMMAIMVKLLQSLSGGGGLSGGPGQFGGGGGGGGPSPLNNFLGGGGGSGASGSSAGGSGPAPAGTVDPSSVKDKSGTSGLNGAAINGLNEAHKFGLPLVSGKRSGGGKSDHDHGDAIDVGTLPIGSPSSTRGTPEMRAFAEKMREDGKAGRSKVKYIIRDGEIASARDNWNWRPYTYPGKSRGELDALKRSNPGEYNRLQHFDHVHVSFN